jgi:putative transcriptional regulator
MRSPKHLKKNEIRKIRTRMNVSQALFARLLNCSVRTIQSWEQGTGEPSGPSLKLLEIAEKNPKALYNN